MAGGGYACRVSSTQAERAQNYGNKITELKYLLSIKKWNMMWKISINFPKQSSERCRGRSRYWVWSRKPSIYSK